MNRYCACAKIIEIRGGAVTELRINCELNHVNRSATLIMSSSTVPSYPPNSKIRSSNPHERVVILRSEQGLEAADPMTIGDMFLSTIKKFPDRTAVCFKESDTVNGDWKKITFAEYYSFALQAAKSFVKVWLVWLLS